MCGISRGLLPLGPQPIQGGSPFARRRFRPRGAAPMQLAPATRPAAGIATLAGGAMARPRPTRERPAQRGYRGSKAAPGCPGPFPPGEGSAPLAPGQPGGCIVDHGVILPTTVAFHHQAGPLGAIVVYHTARENHARSRTGAPSSPERRLTLYATPLYDLCPCGPAGHRGRPCSAAALQG
jgi:hypothetical protein